MQKKYIFIASSLVLGLTMGSIALANAKLVPEITPKFGGSAQLQITSDDQGDAKEITKVKAALPGLFEGNIELGNLNAGERRKLYFGSNSDENYKHLLKQIESIWVNKDAQSHLSEFRDAFNADNEYSMDRSFEKVSLIVDTWQGVQVDGEKATAVFTSHYDYREHGVGRSEAKIQWTVGLVFEDNHWKLESRDFVSNE